MLGVSKTLKFLDDLSGVIVEVMEIKKSGFGWGTYGKVMALLGQADALVAEAKAALPELADLDAQEALQVGAAAYAAIQKIVSAA